MAKDMEGLQKAENALTEMQKVKGRCEYADRTVEINFSFRFRLRN